MPVKDTSLPNQIWYGVSLVELQVVILMGNSAIGRASSQDSVSSMTVASSMEFKSLNLAIPFQIVLSGVHHVDA